MAVLVGREREIQELTEALSGSLDGRGAIVLLSGEPGIGKSRLLDELAAMARGAEATIALGRSWEAGGAPPYWPWIQVIRSFVRNLDPEDVRTDLGIGAADVAQVVPDVRGLVADLPPPPAGDPEQARFRLFDSTASFLRAASARSPLVVLLDDLHAADTPSLLLLRFLARELSGARLLVAAAYRDTEIDADHPLHEALAELLREPATRRISLSRLARADVSAYLESTEGVPSSSRLAETIHGETEGNPLFVVEVVRLLAVEGTAPDDAGSWTLRIPQSVREVIRRRLARLSMGCTLALTAAAVFGREFGIEALSPLADVPRGELLELIDEAAGARVVEELPGAPGRLRFAHILIRESLYDDLSPSQRLRLHRRAGAVLEELYAADVAPHLGELAHHFFESAPEGDAMPAVRYSRLAAERALSLLAHEEAARLYAMALRALDLVVERPEKEPMRAELLLALGDAQARSGDKPSARNTFLRAADMARRLGRAEMLARAALGYGGRFVWEAGRGDPNLPSLLKAALDALPEGDSELRVRVMARLAGGPWRDDPDREPRERLSRQAVEMAHRLGDSGTLAYVLDGRYAAVWWPDNLEERIEIARELAEVARDAADLERELQAHHYLCLAMLERGDMEGVGAELRAQQRIAERLRQPTQRLYVTTVEAMMALFEARFEQAEELISEGFELGARAEDVMAQIYRAMQLAVLRGEQGRGQEALEPLRAAAAAFPSYVVLRCVLAWLLVRIGRTEEARDGMRRLAEDGFASIPRNDEWVFAMSMLGEAAARAGEHDMAGRILELLLPYRDRLAVSAPEACAGPVARTLGLLAAALERWDEAEEHFAFAEGLAARCGAPGWTAWTRFDRASARLARDSSDQATATLLRVALRSANELGLGALGELATAALRSIGETMAEEAPRTTRVFVFTDIVGSTALLEGMGDEGWQQLRAWHNRTLRGLFSEHGGEEVDHAGDGFFVAFADAEAALRCAVRVQQRLDEHRATAGFAPQVRIGMHTAEASLTMDGYAGKGVHAAARIGALAEGGEILASDAMKAAVRRTSGFNNPRDVSLKGIADPMTVWSVDWRSFR